MRAYHWNLGALLLAAAGAMAITHAGEVYRHLEVVLPSGDPVAGRAAFVELSCTSCHRVAGDAALPAPGAADQGPVLGEPSRLRRSSEASRLASSIASPSHVVDGDVDTAAHGGLSPMRDFTGEMTVRQLIDLVAYLQEPEAAQRPRVR